MREKEGEKERKRERGDGICILNYIFFLPILNTGDIRTLLTKFCYIRRLNFPSLGFRKSKC